MTPHSKLNFQFLGLPTGLIPQAARLLEIPVHVCELGVEAAQPGEVVGGGFGGVVVVVEDLSGLV